jgi:hypothetical protein
MINLFVVFLIHDKRYEKYTSLYKNYTFFLFFENNKIFPKSHLGFEKWTFFLSNFEKGNYFMENDR